MEFKKIIFISLGILLLSSVLVSAGIINDITTFIFGENEDWIIEGDSIYIDDSLVYINITPHTSNNPIIEFKSKVYTGDIDIVFGFDTDKAKPVSAKTNPHVEQELKSYTCDYEIGYTLNPNRAWCIEEGLIIFNHSFDSGDLDAKTVYWQENKEVWNEISGTFDSVDLDFKGFNKWYYKKNIAITQDQLYKLKIGIETKSWNESYKYFFGIKPSSETLQQAISNGHFYYLDPWTTSLGDNLTSVWKVDESSGNIEDLINGNNGVPSGDPTYSQTGVNGTAINLDGTGDFFTVADNNSLDVGTGAFSVSFWMKTSTWNSPAGTGIFHKITSGNIGFYIREQSGDRVNMYLGGDGGGYCNVVSTDLGSPSDGAFHHYTFTYGGNGNNCYLFYDNTTTFTGSIVGTVGNLDNTDSLQIGTRPGTALEVTATLDEIYLWKKQLSQEDVSDLYDDGFYVENEELVYCLFSGYVLDENDVGLVGANVTLWNQYNVTDYYENTTIAGGLWTLNITNSTKTYMAGAYYNNSLIGQLKPYISGTC